MEPIEVCVKWNQLDLVLQLVDWEKDDDEWVATAGNVELDYVFSQAHPHPADKTMAFIAGMIADDVERFFNKIAADDDCREVINDRLTTYEDEREDWFASMHQDYLYQQAKDRRRMIARHKLVHA